MKSEYVIFRASPELKNQLYSKYGKNSAAVLRTVLENHLKGGFDEKIWQK